MRCRADCIAAQHLKVVVVELYGAHFSTGTATNTGLNWLLDRWSKQNTVGCFDHGMRRSNAVESPSWAHRWLFANFGCDPDPFDAVIMETGVLIER